MHFTQTLITLPSTFPKQFLVMTKKKLLCSQSSFIQSGELSNKFPRKTMGQTIWIFSMKSTLTNARSCFKYTQGSSEANKKNYPKICPCILKIKLSVQNFWYAVNERKTNIPLSKIENCWKLALRKHRCSYLYLSENDFAKSLRWIAKVFDFVYL